MHLAPVSHHHYHPRLCPLADSMLAATKPQSLAAAAALTLTGLLEQLKGRLLVWLWVLLVSMVGVQEMWG